MLVVHGALDYRVVETGASRPSPPLQRRGIPSKLLYFPDENHWVLKPQQQHPVARHRARLARSLAEGAGGAVADAQI